MTDSVSALPVDDTRTSELKERIETRRRFLERGKPIRFAGSQDRLPLSGIQKSMWLVQQETPDSSSLNCSFLFRIEGSLDIPALENALLRIIQSQEGLRLRVATDDNGDLFGSLFAVPKTCLQTRDHTAEPAPDEAGREWLEEWIRAPFDLDREEPLYRFGLSRIAEGTCLLGIGFHHIVIDGFSYHVFFKKLAEAYARSLSGPDAAQIEAAPDWTAFDFSATQKHFIETGYFQPCLEWYRNQLDGAEVAPLPFDYDYGSTSARSTAWVDGDIDPATLRRIESLAKTLGCTVFSVLLSVYKVMLFRYTGVGDITVGVPAANRRREEFSNIIAPLINTLPIRSRLEKSESFHDVATRIGGTVFTAVTYQEMPLEWLLGKLRPGRDARGQAYFNTLINYRKVPEVSLHLNGCRTEFQPGPVQLGRYALSLGFFPSGETLWYQFLFDESLFREATVKRMADRFRHLLDKVLEEPGCRIDQLPMLLPGEAETLAHWATGPANPYPRDRTLDRLFEETVAQHGHRTAVVSGDRSLNYSELNRLANHLAAQLDGTANPEGFRCGLLMDRSVAILISMLAVLKAGGTYVPLDPNLPDSRLEYMLADSGITCVLADHHNRNRRLPASVILVPVNPDFSDIQDEPNPRIRTDGGNGCANIMYTSGSTGRPKGIEITHRGISRLACNPVHDRVDKNAVVLFGSAVAFDASTWEIWSALLNGARSVILPPRSHDPAVFRDFIRKHALTDIFLTTALFHVFVEEDVDCFAGLRRVVVGGEALRRRPALDFVRHHTCIELVNTYGPTENTIDSAYYVVPHDLPANRVTIPIGYPVANSSCWILDERGELSPVGIPGELHLAGDGLARGYTGPPGRDKTAFIEVKKTFFKGRLYRSGDYCRWNEAGEIEFIGRRDNQVKYRGFRIELGEVESAIETLPAVSRAAVFLLDDETGQPVLAAAISLKRPGALDVASLRECASGILPAYMIPGMIAFFPEFPVNAVGKIERDRLKADLEKATRQSAPPPESTAGDVLDPFEEKVAGVWKEVLGDVPAGPLTSLYALGAHSLQFVRIRSRLERRFKVAVPIKLLYANPTLRHLAAVLKQSSGSESGGSQILPDISGCASGDSHPATWAQKLIWAAVRTAPDTTAYHICQVFHVEERVDQSRLKSAVERIIAVHGILRTGFQETGDQLLQHVEDFIDPPIKALPGREVLGSKGLEDRVSGFVRRPFDLSAAPLFRMAVIDLEDGGALLVWAGHHIIFDGWSVRVFFDQLDRLYPGDSELPSKPLAGVFDLAHWEQLPAVKARFASDVDWWKRYLSGLPPQEWPPEPSEGPESKDGKPVRVVIDQNTIEAINRFLKQETVSLTTLVLASLQGVLSQVCGRREICIGIPVAGRHQACLEQALGSFVNTLPVRGDPAPDEPFSKWVMRFGKVLHSCLNRELAPFDLLVENLESGSHPPASQLISALMTVNEVESRRTRLGGLRVNPIDHSYNQKKAPLTFNLFHTREGITGHVDYDPQILGKPAATALVRAWTAFLHNGVTRPHLPLRELPLTSDEEDAFLRRSCDGPRPDITEWTSVPRRFEEMAGAFPGRPALEWNGELIRYRELASKVEAMAGNLQGKGIRKGDHVAVPAERNPGRIVCELALLKLGAVFVPLDPELPVARREEILQLANARHVADPLDFHGNPPGTGVDTPGPSDPAYVMFTSGSTGMPKGVAVSHEAILRLVLKTNYIDIRPGDTIAHLSNPAFDAVTFEVWGALLNGACLSIVDREDLLDAKRFKRRSGEAGVSHLFLTTALFNVLAREDPSTFEGLKTVLFGGERANATHVREILSGGPPEHLVNVYGPTENTTFSTWYEIPGKIRPEADIPIGRPVANSSAWVLSAWGRPLPVGLSGELHVGGLGLALGYLANEEATRHSFVGVPLDGGRDRRLYRTGDLAWLDENGDLHFHGRRDNQVKIRGHRIEIGEIENAILKHPGVKAVHVLVLGKELETRSLAAFVRLVHGKSEHPDIRAFLSDHLPAYKIPSRIIPLNQFPLNQNGKVDAKELRHLAANLQEPASPRRGPKSPAERFLMQCFTEVLSCRPVSVDDNFFDLGGNSLLALRLLRRLEEHFDRQLTFGLLMEAPTIQSLAAALEGDGHGAHAQQEDYLVLREDGPALPLIGVYGHGHLSSPYVWRQVAERLEAPQRVYGIEGAGIDSDWVRHRTLGALAAEHAASLLDIARNGATVTGYCRGGMLAYELLTQLRKLGASADHLMLIDCMEPSEEKRWNRKRQLRQAGRHINGVLRNGPGYAFNWFWETTRIRIGTIKRKWWHKRAQFSGNSQSGLSGSARNAQLGIALENLFDHWTPAPLECRLDLIRSSLMKGVADDYGWSKVVKGPVTVHHLEVGHFMMQSEELDRVSELINRILAQRPPVR